MNVHQHSPVTSAQIKTQITLSTPEVFLGPPCSRGWPAHCSQVSLVFDPRECGMNDTTCAPLDAASLAQRCEMHRATAWSCADKSLFVHCAAGEQLGCSPLGAVMSRAKLNLVACVLWCEGRTYFVCASCREGLLGCRV